MQKKISSSHGHLYNALFHHSPLGIIHFDKEGNITTCNDQFAQIIGSSKERLIGFNMLKNITNHLLLDAIKNSLDFGFGKMDGEYTAITSGKKSFVHALFFGFANEQDEVVEGIGIIQDMSEQKKLEETLELTKFSIDNSNIAIFWIEAIDGSIFFANKKACESLGYSLDELLALKIPDIDPNFTKSIWDKHAKLILEKRDMRFETEHKRKDKSTFPVEIIAKILKFNGKEYNIAFVLDISERKNIQKKFDLTQYSVDQATLGIFWVNQTGKILYANGSACKSLGYDQNEIIDKLTISHVDPLMPKESWETQWKRLRTMRMSHFESLHKKKSGEVYPVEIFINYIQKEDEEILVAFVEDISKQKEAQKSLILSEKLLRESQEIANIGSWELDFNTNHLTWSDQVYKIFGLDKNQKPASYEDFLNAIHPEDREAVNDAYMQSIETRKPYDIIHRLFINKEIRFVHEQCKTEFSDDNRPLRSIGTVRDITDEYNLAQRVEYFSNYDDLTHLPNRFLFSKKLNKNIEDILHLQYPFLALCFIDLDNFKYINDTYGHDTGDEMLKEFVKRLQEKVSHRGWIARFGGDEFAVVLEDVRLPSHVASIADSMIQMMKQPFLINNESHQMSVSIGISLYPHDATSAQDLITFADTTMHRAKEFGKSRYEFYTSDLTQKMMRKMQLLTQLDEALLKNQFELYYQLQVDLITQRTIGFEALIRWHHPTLGFISPLDFIPIAEESKFIIPLGNWVLEEACSTIKKWQDTFSFEGVMAVNVSSIQLNDGDFAKIVEKTLAKTQLPAKYLELEITESSLMSNSKHSLEQLKKLDELHINLAIDDFGTGYSSLSYLRKMPIKTLKIDQSFIRDLPQDIDACTVVETIIGLSQTMKMQALAEGIETKEQLDFLIQSGCKRGQGYLFSKPLHVRDAQAFLLNKSYSS